LTEVKFTQIIWSPVPYYVSHVRMLHVHVWQKYIRVIWSSGSKICKGRLKTTVSVWLRQ